MSLQSKAKALAPTTGRPSAFGAMRDGLTAKQRRELDEALADRTLSDQSLQTAIENEYGQRFSPATVGNWRKRRRLR